MNDEIYFYLLHRTQQPRAAREDVIGDKIYFKNTKSTRKCFLREADPGHLFGATRGRTHYCTRPLRESLKQLSQTRTLFVYPLDSSLTLFELHWSQKMPPQERQWCLRVISENFAGAPCRFPRQRLFIHSFTSESSTQPPTPSVRLTRATVNRPPHATLETTFLIDLPSLSLKSTICGEALCPKFAFSTAPMASALLLFGVASDIAFATDMRTLFRLPLPADPPLSLLSLSVNVPSCL